MSVAPASDLGASFPNGETAAGLYAPPARAAGGAEPPPTATPAPEPVRLPKIAAHAMRGSISKREQVMFITQLAIMTRSGVGVADALRSISARAKRPALRAAMEELHELLQEGKCLSQALAAHEGRFDGVVVASVTAGEASGTLPEVLGRLGALMRDELRTKAAIRSVLSYPIVLTIVTFGVLCGMIFFVLPQFAGIYESSRAPTPVVTRLLLDGASLLRAYWWATALAAAAAGAGLWRAARSTTGRRLLDNLCFSLPLLANVCRSLCVGRAFRLQGVMLDSGVPLLEVLELTQQASKSTLMRELNEEMQQAVLVGKSMSSAMNDSPCIPEGALEMVATAESNGQLASVLQTVGEFFEGEGEQRLKELVKLAEPVIIVLLGVVVGAIVLAVMLPMLDLSSAGGR